MKKIIISLTTILAFQVNAQMKIGSNVKTLNSNTNLQVEAVSGDQVIITRDSGKVGIGTLSPAVKLDVIGTVKITDGTQGTGKVLVSDANGQASWQNASTLQAVNKDSTTASNGLTLSGKDVQLGGTLIKATTISTSASNTIALAGLQSGATSDSILVVNPSTGVVARKSAAAIAAGNTTHAILFNNTSKILTSTVNGVTDTTVINLTSLDSTTASNGLTLSGKDVQLGGTLTKATTISTSASNTIALAGLQSGATSDSILVVNPSTGVIRRLSPSVLGSATEPWFSTTTNIGATLNTENIYQMGKVGINFNNPTEQLEVNGNIFQRGYSYFKKNTGNTSAYIWTDFTSAGDAINYSFNYHNVASADTVFNSGYGTNTFSQRNAGFYFNTSNGVNGASPSTNVMTITNVGRVGINTINPTARLHVIDTSNNMPLRLEGLTSGSVATDSVLVATSTGVVKRISLTNAVDNSVGAISIFPYSAIPSGYLECNGQAISRTTYADLFAKIGTTYGTGNGSTTFNLPDLRGEFVRGWDNGRGVDNGRTIGSYQTGSVNIVQTAVVPSSQFSLLGLGTTGAFASDLGYDMNNINGNYPNARRTVLASPTGITNHYVDNAFLTGNQWGMSRPRNVAMVYAMKVSPSLNFTSGGSSSSNTEPWFSTTTNIGATSNSENIYQMGRVGVGTNNPIYQLDVRTNSNTSTQNAHFVNINSGTSAESQVGIGAGPGPWAKIVGYNDAIGFRNYSTGKENLTIRNGSGNIGIGTTTPPFKLTIIDTVAGGPSRFYMSNRSSAVNSHTEIIAQNDQGVNCLIGIMASTSNSSNPVTAASGTSSYVKSTDGPIYVMAGGFGVRLGVNGTSWISNSDRRIKKDILKIENGLNKLLTLNGYTYNYNADKDGEPRRVGVMAQEVQAVLPEAVTANNDGILGVKYSELTPLIIEAVKDLKIELDHKNKEIQEQKILIDQLFKELSEIKNKLR